MSEEYTKIGGAPSKQYISGITADFDRLFELSWKTMKDYLEDLGILEAKTGSPKLILKLAYQENIISDSIWLQMLEDRNNDAHQYVEQVARGYAARIQRDYLPVISDFIESMSERIPDEQEVLEKIPDKFLRECEESGLYFDEFVKLKMGEYKVDSPAELFRVIASQAGENPDKPTEQVRATHTGCDEMNI